MRRLYLTRREYEELLERQGGKCCVPGCDEMEGLIAEHSTPNALKPGKPDQLMCRACHKVKTGSGRQGDRQGQATERKTMSQYERRKKFGSSLKGRGFWKREGCLPAQA